MSQPVPPILLPPPPDPAAIGFRPLTLGGLLLLHRWLVTPHVQQWWASDGNYYTMERVEREYRPTITGEEPTAGFIITHATSPIGFIQWYYLRDYPEADALIGVPHAAGIDLFIGEEAYLHRGLGAPLLRQFLREVVFAAPGVRTCIIDPAVPNTAAIRAYEKAGFRYFKTMHPPDEPYPEHVMRLERSDLTGE